MTKTHTDADDQSVTSDHDLLLQLEKKRKRKASAGAAPKLKNIPRNWIHQAISYMDAGELSVRIIVEATEFFILLQLVDYIWPDSSLTFKALSVFLVVHTWNWIFNGLFWAVMIFTFPGLRNPGLEKTVAYLKDMTVRLDKRSSISGFAIYGSVSRGKWHDRSDIDLRLLRRTGAVNLIAAAFVTMHERFLACVYRQPIDMFLADDTDFLEKMRSDEVPVFLIKDDRRLDEMYPGNDVQVIESCHLQ